MNSLQEKQCGFYCRLKGPESLAHGFPLYRDSTFAEDYRSGKLSLVLVFRAIRVDDVGPINDILCCAVFSSLMPNVRHLRLRNEQPVLVSNIELMESINEVTDNVPSLVRLYHVQEFPAEAHDGILFFSGLDELFKMFPGWVYGKSDPVFGNRTVGGGEVEPCKIESRSEVVNGISSDNGEACNNLPTGRKSVDALAALRIEINGMGIRCEVASEDLGGVRIEFVHVLSGPFDL